jgi:hypothetical protein
MRLRPKMPKFLRMSGYSRSDLGPLREFGRWTQELRTQPAPELSRIAIHEAGHAVLRIAFGNAVVAVSIVPDLRTGSAGAVVFQNRIASAQLRLAERDAFFLREAISCYAGAEAVRQLLPTDPHPDGGASLDRRQAAEHILAQISGHPAAMELLFSLARRRCALLVAHYQPEILAVAGALQAQLTMSGEIARAVFMTSLSKRSAGLIGLETDPTSPALPGDEAFQSFLRYVKLAGRPH